MTNLLCMDKCLGRNVTERERDRQTDTERQRELYTKHTQTHV